MDRGYTWHFDDEVHGLLSRAFIGGLDPEVHLQELNNCCPNQKNLCQFASRDNNSRLD